MLTEETRMSDHPMLYETEDPENPGQTLKWLRIPVAKASTPKAIEYVDVCTSKIPVTEYAEALFRGLKSLVNMGATKVSNDKSEASKKVAIVVAIEQVEKIYSGKIRISGGRGKTGDSQEVMVLARQKAVKKLKAQAKREGKVKVSLVAAAKWTALAKMLLETEHGLPIIEEARKEVAAYEKTTVGIDLSELKEDDKLVAAAAKKKKAAKQASEDVDKLVAGVIAQSRKGEGAGLRH
jgi:hypothetical protein